MRNLLWATACAACLLLGFGWGRHTAPTELLTQPVIIVDTVFDTITVVAPAPTRQQALRTKFIKVPVHTPDSARSQPIDSVPKQDSIIVALPISQKEYHDSAYHAWVSGYDATLDSIMIFPKTIHSIQTLVKQDHKRFGISIQLGTGYTGGKVNPYIGIGISYNLWNF